jgi:NSS family neurotransmitter:Na+ symporter
LNRNVSSEIPQWGSSLGFLLAALGSAIGIGNIWRFSYVVGENGGGAFILVYLLAVTILGLPLLIAELAIGQRSRANPVTSFTRIAPTMPWRLAGWPGVIGSIAILAYYPVIAGWVARYLWAYASDDPRMAGAAGHAAYFESFIASPVQPLLWFALVIAIAAAIVAAGVERGIEFASRVLMPAFALLVLLLAGYGLTLPGAPRALAFLFTPDWSMLGEPGTYLAAIGQAFFSIGLAMGILVTYGGYLSPSERLPRAALVIAAGDTLIALLAGLVIFPAVFTHGIDPAQGPTLAFVVLPEVFATLPAGRWIAAAFFLLLLVAALTSVIALLEVPVSLAMAKWRLRRPHAVLLVTGGVLLLGSPVALGYGSLRVLLPGGRFLLDLADHLASNLVLPLSGIAIALFAGWAWPKADATRMSGLADRRLQIIWLWLLRLAIPAIIALVMVRGL